MHRCSTPTYIRERGAFHVVPDYMSAQVGHTQTQKCTSKGHRLHLYPATLWTQETHTHRITYNVCRYTCHVLMTQSTMLKALLNINNKVYICCFSSLSIDMLYCQQLHRDMMNKIKTFYILVTNRCSHYATIQYQWVRHCLMVLYYQHTHKFVHVLAPCIVYTDHSFSD